MSYSGFDIEDAVVLNKSSIEWGFGRAILSKKFVAELETNIFNEGEIILGNEVN